MTAYERLISDWSSDVCSSELAAIRIATAEITRPASVTMKNMVSGVASIDEVLASYWRAGSQNVALRRQVEADRNRIIEAKAVAQENLRLKKLLKLVEDDGSELRSEEHTSELQSLMRT